MNWRWKTLDALLRNSGSEFGSFTPKELEGQSIREICCAFHSLLQLFNSLGDPLCLRPGRGSMTQGAQRSCAREELEDIRHLLVRGAHAGDTLSVLSSIML